MNRPDLVLLHPPSVLGFRERPQFWGPVSDVVPSTSVFEIYPIGFLTISEHLSRHGLSVRIVNMALKMLLSSRYEPEAALRRLRPGIAFGIDLHWLPHVDGSLGLAQLAKQVHPDVPVILGGLSASYYHEEILRDHPAVDFVLRGDSAEEPLRRLLLAIRTGEGFETVPNLTWRDRDGRVVANPLTHVAPDMDQVSFDYPHLLKMAIKYRDPSGYLPFKYWHSYPVTAVFTCRGCRHNCSTCGGSVSAFRRVCHRESACFRSPELLADDIRRIAEYTAAPIIMLGDILQAGREHTSRFLSAMRKTPVKNEIALEFFSPPSLDLLKEVADSLRSFNVEISPESHDIHVRRAFGKDYTNDDLEGMIEGLLDVGCKRVDLFFMVGLPHQDRQSVRDTVRYCGDLLARYGWNGRLLPMIAPLAPFVDPGSSIFEDPGRFGYHIFHRTLADHRKAMLSPSWKFTLNYETKWMTRDDIVRATYEAALGLTDLKEKHGVIGKKTASAVRDHTRRALALVERINDPDRLDESLWQEIRDLNTLDQLCDKHELDWPIRGWKMNLMGLGRMLLRKSGGNGAGNKDAATIGRGSSVT